LFANLQWPESVQVVSENEEPEGPGFNQAESQRREPSSLLPQAGVKPAGRNDWIAFRECLRLQQGPQET
jgi:hypothetical protein